MYNKDFNQTIQASQRISDMDHAQAAKEQDKHDEKCSDLEDKAVSSNTTVVPFSKTKTGSFQ